MINRELYRVTLKPWKNETSLKKETQRFLGRFTYEINATTQYICQERNLLVFLLGGKETSVAMTTGQVL